MSTSFEVYPRIINITYSDVLNRFNEKVHKYLKTLGINKNFSFDISRHFRNEYKEINYLDNFSIRDDEFLSVSTINVNGGFYIYQYSNDDLCKEIWKDEFNREQLKNYKELILESLEKTYHWSIVRYAATHAFYNLSYGIFASALAELTEGIIFSDDNAWDYSCFPCLAKEFDNFYFISEHCSRIEDRNWVIQNIGHLKNNSFT